MAANPTRQNEILTLLARYGVMDATTLMKLMNSAPSKRSVQITLRRLAEKGLIVQGNIKISGTAAHYWMIDPNEAVQEVVQARTGVSSDHFRERSIHWSQYPHEAICTIFQASIERQMPSLWVLREGTRNFKSLPEHLISDRVKENGYTPDLCIGIPLQKTNSAYAGSGAYRWIAVEIDRTPRSKKRISSRANIYSRHTSFAGLLYFVPNIQSIEQLSKIYTDRGAKKSLRISGGSDTFLASAVSSDALFDVNLKMVRCGQTEVSLATWIALFSVSEVRRRDDVLNSIVSQGYTFDVR